MIAPYAMTNVPPPGVVAARMYVITVTTSPANSQQPPTIISRRRVFEVVSAPANSARAEIRKLHNWRQMLKIIAARMIAMVAPGQNKAMNMIARTPITHRATERISLGRLVEALGVDDSSCNEVPQRWQYVWADSFSSPQ